MSEVFEVKRSKLFYEYNGCQCDNVGDVLSFKGVGTSFDYAGRVVAEDVVIGFFDYNSNSYYWFYEDFDEFYLSQLGDFNPYESSLNELEKAVSESMAHGTFKLTHVAHDYSLFIQRE